MIKYSSKNSLQINQSGISPNDTIFKKSVFIGNNKYSVRSIKVTEGELTASSVDGEKFGLTFAGVRYFSSFGFSGNSLLVYFYYYLINLLFTPRWHFCPLNIKS